MGNSLVELHVEVKRVRTDVTRGFWKRHSDSTNWVVQMIGVDESRHAIVVMMTSAAYDNHDVISVDVDTLNTMYRHNRGKNGRDPVPFPAAEVREGVATGVDPLPCGRAE